ncbi:MAG: VOC family protein [bacterium]|nr:VOC family protein [bacterium]
MSKLGWRYHHLGIPTDTPRPDEVYLEKLGMYVSGFKTSPFGIEWMRFEENSPISELIRTVPHIAFEVDDIETALKSVNIEAEISSPSEGVRVAMLIHNGAPIELIEFSQNK